MNASAEKIGDRVKLRSRTSRYGVFIEENKAILVASRVPSNHPCPSPCSSRICRDSTLHESHPKGDMDDAVGSTYFLPENGNLHVRFITTEELTAD